MIICQTVEVLVYVMCIVQSNELQTSKTKAVQARGREEKSESRYLQSTDRGSNFVGDHVNHALTNLTPVQLLKRLLCNIEATRGGVDGGNLNRHSRSRVRDVPAPAAIRRVALNVESAANEREVRDIAEGRESRRKTVGPVRACNAVERASLVVERSVVRGTQGKRCVRLRVFIVGLAVIRL